MADPLLDVKEAAEYLKVNVSTLQKWAARGEIPHAKVGRLLRFRLGDLDRWIFDRAALVQAERERRRAMS